MARRPGEYSPKNSDNLQLALGSAPKLPDNLAAPEKTGFQPSPEPDRVDNLSALPNGKIWRKDIESFLYTIKMSCIIVTIGE